MAYLYDVKEPKLDDDESKKAYTERTKDEVPLRGSASVRSRRSTRRATPRKELRRWLPRILKEGPAHARRDGHSRADLIPCVTKEAVSPRRGQLL